MRRNGKSQCFFVLLFLFAMQFVVQAQTPAAPAPTPIVAPARSLEREFFKNILRDQKAIWTSPFHLERKDAKWMIPAGIGLGALITTDRMTGDEIAEFDGGVAASRIISYPGSTFGVAGVAATFYFVGRRTNNGRARETGILTAEAALDSLIVGEALKAASQRARPAAGRGSCRRTRRRGGQPARNGRLVAATRAGAAGTGRSWAASAACSASSSSSS